MRNITLAGVVILSAMGGAAQSATVDVQPGPDNLTRFLRAHGWRAGGGYQPGEANFGAIRAWNAAPVYQQAIALIGRQIDGGEGTSARR